MKFFFADSGEKSCFNDEGIKIQESNINNSTDTDKIIQSHFFIDGSQGDVNSLIRIGNENPENSINKIETTSNNNYINTPKVLSLPVVSKKSSETVTNSLMNVEEDDFQTTQAIMSLALNISQQGINFGYPDGFEEGNITNESYTSINNDNKNSSSIIEKNADPAKLEEEYTINGLKILESLVNIEHSKLEVQKTSTENKLLQSNIKLKETEQGILSNKVNLKKKKNQRSKEQLNINLEEEWSPNKEKKVHSKNRKKFSERKRTLKTNNKKVKSQNNLNDSFPSHTVNNCVETQDQNISFVIEDSSYSSFTKKSDISTITTNTKTVDSTNSVVVVLTSQNTKDKSSTNKLKTLMGDNSMLVIKNKNIKTTSFTSINTAIDSTSTMKITSPVTTSFGSHNEKYVHTSKNNTYNFCSPKKILDYQKLYEKDRKSLFNPDIIISSKSVKDLTNNTTCIIKDTNSLQKNDLQSKSQNGNLKSIGNLYTKKQKNSQHINKRVNSELLKKKPNIKSISNSVSRLNKKSPCSSTIVSKYNKFKKLKVCKSDSKFKINVNTNKTEELKNTKISGNKDLNSINRNFEKNRSAILDNSNVDSMDIFENKELKEKKWIKEQCELYNIKPSYVVIDRNKKYY